MIIKFPEDEKGFQVTQFNTGSVDHVDLGDLAIMNFNKVAIFVTPEEAQTVINGLQKSLDDIRHRTLEEV